MIHRHTTQGGYITLISTLVVGAVGIAVVAALLTQGVGLSRSAFAREQSAQSGALADACAEEALQQLADNNTFVGTQGLTLGQGSCSYTVTNTGGSTRRVESTGTVGTVTRKVLVVVSVISPQVQLSSWQEVVDF